jgi:hypothetical protein
MINQPPPDLAVGNVREPGAIKTFGVLHLVIAGVGCLTLLIKIMAAVYNDTLSKFQADVTGESTELHEIQMAYMNEMLPFTWLSIAFSLILTVMLVLAGIQLLKIRDKGRILSVRYAWMSLVTKALILIGTIFIVMPATSRMSEKIVEGVPVVAALNDTMSALMPAVQIFSILITCIYPVVVLVMMNNATIKSYLKNR